MSQVLYFPNLSLPDSSWVNPAILFFERIGVISPDDARQGDLFDDRTAALISAEVVQPVWPGNYYNWNSNSEELLFQDILKTARVRTQQGEFERLHVGKFGGSRLLQKLLEAKLIRGERYSNWVETPDWMGLQLMSYLAIQISSSPELAMGLVTDRGNAWTGLAGRRKSEHQANLRLRAVTSLLPVSPEASVDSLLAFRQRHHPHLKQFQQQIESLLVDETEPDRGETLQFEARLREAEKARDELVKILAEQNWGKAAVRVALSALPMVSSVADHSTWSAAAGLVPLAQQLRDEWQTWRASQNALKEPLAFAALVQNELG